MGNRIRGFHIEAKIQTPECQTSCKATSDWPPQQFLPINYCIWVSAWGSFYCSCVVPRWMWHCNQQTTLGSATSTFQQVREGSKSESQSARDLSRLRTKEDLTFWSKWRKKTWKLTESEDVWHPMRISHTVQQQEEKPRGAPESGVKYQQGGDLHGAAGVDRIVNPSTGIFPRYFCSLCHSWNAAARSRRDHHRRVGRRFPHIHLAKSTACPAHCAKKKQPPDSAEEDDGGGGGGGGGGASMLGRAEFEEIHLRRDTGRDWRGAEGGRAEGCGAPAGASESVRECSGGLSRLASPSSSCCTAAQHLTSRHTSSGRAHRVDRACLSATADHTSPLHLDLLLTLSSLALHLPPSFLPSPGLGCAASHPLLSSFLPNCFLGSVRWHVLLAARRRRAQPWKPVNEFEKIGCVWWESVRLGLMELRGADLSLDSQHDESPLLARSSIFSLWNCNSFILAFFLRLW